ncbi:hypothetical protein [Arthrobacter sp. 18067]|uniref:hypothetical protein n=1 Tax=Arthrobacter sp. 18067 TaxID=2681413 RepID=UPI00135A0B0E|nr:hypothetical protein [Arthrobacter sp. 18067]
MSTQVTRATDNKAGMTLGDLMQFVQEAEAAGVDPRETVLVRVGFTAQIKRITVGGKL